MNKVDYGGATALKSYVYLKEIFGHNICETLVVDI